MGDAAKARRYRERAVELRKIAEGLSEGNIRRIVLGIALEYERLAQLLEESDTTPDQLEMIAALKKRGD